MSFGSLFSSDGGIMGMSLAHNLRVEDENRQRLHDSMDFQKDMSNTAHTREVADLRRAGLNPILSAGGKGASTPSGAFGMPAEVDPTSNAISHMRATTEQEVAKTQAGANSAQAAKVAEEAQQLKWLNQYYATPAGRKALIYRDQKNMVGGLGAVGSTIIDPVVNSAKSASRAVRSFVNKPGSSLESPAQAEKSKVFKSTHPLRR